MKPFPGPLAATLVLLLTSSPALPMSGSLPAVNMIDPPVVLSNDSDRSLIVKWQTSIPGVAASPVEEIVLAPNTENEHLNHANLWVTEAEAPDDMRPIPNMIEVWIYAADAPTLLLASYRTFRELYPYSLREEDKTVILDIAISSTIGIDVKLDRLR